MSDKAALIEEYFNRETSDERKAELKKLLSIDSDDRIMMDLVEALQGEEEISKLKERIEKLEEPKKKLGFLLKIAASISFIIFASIVIFKLLESNSTDQLFTRYYTPYDGVVTARGEASNLANGMTSYNEGSYQKALDFFLNLREKEITDGQLSLLISSCYLGLDEPDKSILQLSEEFDDESKLIESNRKWYLALSYLQKNDIDASKELLQNLIDTRSPYEKDASELLTELD